MLSKFMSKINPTNEALEKELIGGDFDSVNAKSIISSKNVNINKLNSNGDSLLHTCLKNNKIKSAIWLVENGIKTDNYNKDNVSDVVMSVEKGNSLLVDTLFKMKQIDINYKDQNGRTLLQDAVMSGKKDIIKYLVTNKKVDLNSKDKSQKSVIFDALAYGDEDIINEIINMNGIDLNIKDINGNTILHNKKVLNDDELAKELLQNGADPTVCDTDGHNFLSKTALRGEAGEAILDIAIKCGCDLNAKTVNNNSILMEVMFAFAKVSNGEKERRGGLKNIAKKLIKNGVEIDAINDFGETSLFDMIKINDIEGCAFLLENKVPVNHQNKHRETALSIAILNGIVNIDIIILLLQYGADPKIRNKHNQTIPEVLNNIILHTHNYKTLEDKILLSKINPMGNYMVLLKELLLIEDLDFNYLDSSGQPLFFKLFFYNDIKTCKLYLENGLDINLKNSDGHTLFYQYILNVFEKDEYFEEFRERLIFLLVNNANTQSTNPSHQTVYTKIALIKNCNLKLFRKLIEVTRYDYTSVDNMGRTIIHSCVWSGNLELLKLVYGIGKDIQNIPDKFNVLPITYAALFGNQEIVLEFLKKEVLLKSNKPIHSVAKQKFKPLLKNLSKLTNGIEDADILRKVRILQDQVLRDLT
ncbi:MAG: ankyrin repeat domain-containing protein [Campylobacterota bacterium]|nr:ankyrin repeat domain-containing protein [Campylobacterota bacterium]